MNRSKSAAVLMLAGTLVVGGVAGYLFRGYQTEPRDRGTQSDGSYRKRVYDNLMLNSAQQAQWDSLIDYRNRMVNEVYAIPRAKAESIRAETREKQWAILNVEQRAKLDSILASMNARKSAQGRGKVNTPGTQVPDNNKKTNPPGKKQP
jgi:hypothetical protein